ncbi:unnamed protein product [Prorocentrum cordatum]|uniref:Uncharacterized protein n=1 Tax=Prorocentrum cordatum TaxID=2364126 RepID=A0ABN9VX03_9DINO|nr:unnamed protein product [Polarella glacialis]CAK0878146.1 unnamed protein product [Polarella glacialis]
MPSSSMCRRRGSITPGRLLVALLAASAGGARAARVRAAARLSAGAHRLLDGLLGAPSAAAPPGPAEAAAAVVDFLRAGGAGGGGNATAAARPACAGFLARSLGGLNESWSDVQLEAALNSTCSERALFTKVVTNGSAEHLDCLSFSSRLARARRAGAANGSSSAGYAAVCEEYAVLVSKQGPDESSTELAAEEEAEAGTGFIWIVQVIFGVVYYFTVVSKYPVVKEGPEAIPEEHPAKLLQDQNELSSLTKVSPTNCMLSFCCPAARASHTFHSTETLNYWISCGIMTCFPFWGTCCALFIANSCTPMNRKLGGEERNVVMSLVCTWCCPCCVIAQDAESMDLLVGVKTGVCGVTQAEN